MELTLDSISFLQNQDADEIHKRMLEELPGDLDKTKGGFVHDFTYPTALEKSRFAEEQILRAIMCIFPQFAFGEFLNYHAETRGMARKEATRATGKVQVMAKAGTHLPIGTIFSTLADDNTNYIEFATVEEGITESDSEAVELAVEAVNAGVEGNVSANAIVVMGTKINGILSVNNAEPTSGGTEIEDDEALRERIMSFDTLRSVSFVGSKADYERWALEVPGVGTAYCIPTQSDDGLVTLIITDSNGNPANEQLMTDVYNHIQSPDNPDARLTNVNANLSVITPTVIHIKISATVELDTPDTLGSVKAMFVSSLKEYLSDCDGEIKYSKIYEKLSGTEGIHDLSDLLVNDGTTNIKVSINELPVVVDEDVTLTEGVIG